MDIGAIVLAGGSGDRMRPLTDECPKPLLPLAAEPLVAYQLRRLAEAGVQRVVLATGYLADHFVQLGDGSRWGIDLVLSVEDTPLGTGGALRAAADRLPDVDRVVVLNGDLLSSHDLQAQVRASPDADVCLHVRHVPDIAPYGHVTVNPAGRVTAFAEKSGTGPGDVNAGSYVISAATLRSLPGGRSSWERDVLPALIGDGARVVAWQGDGYFRDVGSPAAYRMACVDAVTGELPGAPLHEGAVYVAPGATVARDAELGRGTSVQDGAVVATGAVVGGCVLLEGARVGAGARLERCVVARGAVVPAGAIVAGEVLTDIPTHR